MEWLDFSILDWFVTIRNPVLTAILKALTISGEFGALWIALGIILIARKSTRHIGITVILALLLSLIVCNLSLKYIVARPRPCWLRPEVPMLIGIPKDYSFPSGHASASFAAAVAVFAWNKRIGTGAIAIAILMCISRLYFYVHFPSDVLAGAVTGSLLGIAAYYIMRRMRRRAVVPD